MGYKNQQLDTQNNIKNSKFNASKSVFVDKDEYLYGNVNNKTGWIAAKDLNKTPTQSKITPQNSTMLFTMPMVTITLILMLQNQLDH